MEKLPARYPLLGFRKDQGLPPKINMILNIPKTMTYMTMFAMSNEGMCDCVRRYNSEARPRTRTVVSQAKLGQIAHPRNSKIDQPVNRLWYCVIQYLYYKQLLSTHYYYEMKSIVLYLRFHSPVKPIVLHSFFIYYSSLFLSTK